MFGRAFRCLSAVGLASLALAAFGTPLHAQDNSVAGHVRAMGSNEPLAGAQITVANSALRASSDDDGRFRITGLSGTTVTLDVRRIGYRGERVTARVGKQDVIVQLTSNPTSLEGIVVTGQPGATARREIGNAVGEIAAADIVAVAPVINMQGLLNGRTPSLVVLPTSGQVGTGSQIRIRGQASLSLGNNPLVFVDGVRVNNDPSTGPQSQSFSSSPISRINDFNPDDIESIEVLKGPSAATLYGTDAVNGVINIITKKGAARTARWNFTTRQGANYFADYRNRFPVNYGPARLATDNPSGAATGPVQALNFDSLLVGACGDSIATRTGKKCDIYRTGRHQETELAVSGGAGVLNYYVSGNLLDDQGAEPRSSRRNYGGRMNVNLAPSQKFNIAANVGYVTGPTNLPCDAGCGGYTWTTLSATPSNYNLAQRHGFHSSLPYQYDQTVVLWQDVARTTASVRLEHQPLPWLSHRLTLGGDVTNEDNNEWDPRVDSLGSLGFREDNPRDVVNRSLDYSATANWNYRPSMKFTTSLGAQYWTQSIHSVDVSGSVFPTPGLEAVTSTTNRNPPSELFSDDKSLGIYGQEEFGWRDRLFLTGAVRSDDHSAFGASFNRVIYPKFSLSYVLSQEPWFQIPLLGHNLDEFRFRAAYGESGKAPTTYSSIKTYSPTAGPGDAAAVTPNTIGNPNLGPERGKELEVGFDMSAWQNRFGGELTYYHKKTVDAILDKVVAPSSGQAGTQPINIGGILNSGWELSVHGTPLRMRNVALDLTGQFSTNDNEVTDIGIPGQYFVVAGTYLRHQVGEPAFSWYEKRVVSATINRQTGAISNVMCSDTIPGSHGKEGGAPRLCAGSDGKYGTADDAPMVYLGRSVPPREFSFSGNLTFFNRLHIFSMMDVKNGQKKMDGNTRVRCGIFGRCQENFLGTFAASVDSIRAAEANSSSNLVDFLITKANFARWRELTFTWDVPERFVQKAGANRASLAVSGRNLGLWTSYQGFEPEAMFLGGTRGGNAAWEQTTLPQLRTWLVSLNLTL
ncbi:MAG TPA: SusC/RagA family TonB-linked outer membrane protein [Gemmatimonadaceae bacterium]|jgi:TonB-linked SusC/RagA family outer membrane protein|nr:SusC/RagA family TonB-linked outer membrane protein [Gemmatimonadaceae bacterium]